MKDCWSGTYRLDHCDHCLQNILHLFALTRKDLKPSKTCVKCDRLTIIGGKDGKGTKKISGT